MPDYGNLVFNKRRRKEPFENLGDRFHADAFVHGTVRKVAIATVDIA